MRRALNGTVQASRECVALERFAEGLTPAERAHVAGCVRCQKEAALWSSLNDPAPRGDENADVQWIVKELERRNAAPAAAAARRPFWRPLSAIAAALVLAAALGYALRDRVPQLTGTGGAETYRGTRLQVTSPVGDQRDLPRRLEWLAVDGAVNYEVSMFEVDRTPLWSGSSSVPRVEVPPAAAARFVPGKTVMWEVVARDASGVSLASSGPQSFRVVAR